MISSSLFAGGGVWRTKWHVDSDSGGEHLFNACMQGGSRVYRLHSVVRAQGDGIESAASYEYSLANSVEQTDARNSNHLAYGIDCICSRRIVAGASFQFT